MLQPKWTHSAQIQYASKPKKHACECDELSTQDIVQFTTAVHHGNRSFWDTQRLKQSVANLFEVKVAMQLY